MTASTSQNNEAICSVAAMAERLGLSRSRFYQLLSKGLLPPPVYTLQRRPFYTPALQAKCLTIRRTGIACNGQPVLFNRPRKRSEALSRLDTRYENLKEALRSLDLEVDTGEIKKALAALYPRGVGKPSSVDEVIRDLFRHFVAPHGNGVQFM